MNPIVVLKSNKMQSRLEFYDNFNKKICFSAYIMNLTDQQKFICMYMYVYNTYLNQLKLPCVDICYRNWDEESNKIV